MFKHILIPTDGSAASAKAVETGVQLAKAVGAKVTGLFAAPPATPIVYRENMPVGYTTPKDHARMIDKTAGRHLDAIAAAARKAKVPFTAMQVTSDFPADEILAIARKRKCDLIVMATHGRKGLRRLLSGSETDKVLAKTRIPVLVCR